MPKKERPPKEDRPDKPGGGKGKPDKGGGEDPGTGEDPGGEAPGIVVTPKTGALENQSGTISRGKILGNVYGLK